MNHLGFILAAYAIGVLVPFAFAVVAWTRVARATRQLLAIDPRRQRSRA
jgi:cytochrome c biogenesis protein CcdA